MGVLAHISPSIRLPRGCRHSRMCRVTVYEIFRLEGLVLHLLKWRYQPDYQTRSWRDAIVENRARIPDCLTESPSLRPQLPTLLQECYPHAQRRAARQTRLPLATFPETCPWTVEQVLNAAFWPDSYSVHRT